MLVAKLAGVISELDNWEHGCAGECELDHWDITLQAETQNEIIQKMLSYFLIPDRSYLSLNSCGEDGRIDVQLSTADKFDTYPIKNNELEQFKKGEIIAYLTTFTFYVEESKPFKLLEE